MFRQYLAAFSDVLGKAEAHCTSGALTEAEVIGFRLHPDMEPFAFQVRQALVHSAAMVAPSGARARRSRTAKSAAPALG